MVARITGYVTRSQWGAAPPKAVTPLDGRRMSGVAVHHGGAGGYASHAMCAGQWRGYQTMHLRGDRGPQNDIAYNMGVCRHGYVFEGRTLLRQGGANGTSAANRAYFSVCVIGDGDAAYGPLVTDALEWVILQAREKYNAAGAVKRHRDFVSTGCPGSRLSAWTRTVDGRLIATEPATDPTRPRLGDRGQLVGTIQRRLNDHGSNLEVDGVFGPATDAAVRAFQQSHGLDVDGIVGPATMKALTAPPRKEIHDMDAAELEAIVARAVRREIDKEQTARSIFTTHPIMLDPRDPFAPRRAPSNVIEHAAGILHDDDGKPIPPPPG